jgi:hypothetical protein
MRAKISRSPAIGLQPYEWVSMRSLEVARRLNIRCLELLARLAKAGHEGLEIARHHRDLWMQFDSRAGERAARIPVVLLDCHFRRLDWWDRVIRQNGQPVTNSNTLPCIPAEDAGPVLREILVEGRTIAISEPRAASLILGASPGTVSLIAKLTSMDIDRISIECANELRPRWEDKVAFWRNLLVAALGDADDALSEVSFHSLQLLGGELMAPMVGAGGNGGRSKA